MKIVVVIPTYNEAGAIEGVLEELSHAFTQAPQHEWHALVVDGNSTDHTGEIVKDLSKKYPFIHLIVEKEKRGLAPAYVFGIRHAIEKLGADAYVEFDGDGQHDPRYLVPMVEALEAGADYVIGSRYVTGGEVPSQWRLFNKILSRFGSFYSRILLNLPVHDVTSGFKMSRVTGFADKISLSEDELLTTHYAYKIQLMCEMLWAGAEVVEIPISFRHRENGTSKSTWHDITESLRVTAIMRLRKPRLWA